MDDNVMSHQGRKVQEVLEAEEITRIRMASQIPGCESNGELWDFVSRANNNRIDPARTVDELVAAAAQEWNQIRQQVINNLIIFMPRRVHAL